MSAGALFCGIDFQSLECLALDKFSVKELHRQISYLVERDKFLFESLHTDRTALDDPVLAEIAEYDRHLPVFRRRHIIGDNHGLAEYSVVRVIPQIIAVLVLKQT